MASRILCNLPLDIRVREFIHIIQTGYRGQNLSHALKANMPISKVNQKLYPENWKAIALQVKTAANWTCVNPQCLRPCKRPDETWNLFKYRLSRVSKELYLECCEKPTRFVLTTSHVDHNPSNCNLRNLRALCSVCHLRYDAKHHAESRIKNAAALMTEPKPKAKAKPKPKPTKPTTTPTKAVKAKKTSTNVNKTSKTKKKR